MSSQGDTSSTITKNGILELLNNVPFPPVHLNLNQILKTKPHRRKSKDTDTQKRTINSFLLYRKECIEYLKTQNIDNMSNLKQKELSQSIANSWSGQSKRVRDFYKNLADEAKKLHKIISPQIQIRLYNPKSSSGEENKDDFIQTDSEDSPQDIKNDNFAFASNEIDPIIENHNLDESYTDWFAILSDIDNINNYNVNSFAPLATKVDDSSSFQNQLCDFYNSHLTYNQNLYFYHLCKLCFQ
ncbi:hypothetical protein RhiirA5_484243 [Rhizophagus irregularis]|uniref:MATA-HMG n=3 Tax=Rhizophagus irregularis TaxID=588596 RepID=A0A1B1EUH7_9GLOM|nr:hypothetical protein GLOIN_2v1663953 [Rhizophagus irregularis DAOM 181602=DAOM 197198]ANQ32467.1 MATA-HMG [Rhizophagus irregularis]EXX78667.1 hypothetical protein RirG_013080 [Rhizophagus irregularis DAOM 197198w]ANQ32469.1 MATA-HMG [Rhizophagus irregularis]ANQ32470.1 MATA-HMG [Rhizophagus irregularis]ANQ32471.1 MATA-HMG [Rhizophagus irregularis]|eukprot:XP_025172492.1 hypothetical protein GLOIN_2v1663953 [Rhizophagus irregularis DAOM 181602=DAOM 197198]